MYRGEPTLTVSLGFDVTLLAKPKSAIFVDLSFINIFAGFKSRCRNPAYPKFWKPSRMSLIIGIASCYGNFCLFLIKVSRSPSLQNSVIM